MTSYERNKLSTLRKILGQDLNFELAKKVFSKDLEDKKEVYNLLIQKVDSDNSANTKAECQNCLELTKKVELLQSQKPQAITGMGTDMKRTQKLMRAAGIMSFEELAKRLNVAPDYEPPEKEPGCWPWGLDLPKGFPEADYQWCENAKDLADGVRGWLAITKAVPINQGGV